MNIGYAKKHMKQYYIKEYNDRYRTKVIAIPVFENNYIYVMTDDSRKAFIVDPGDANPVCHILEELGLDPVYLLITHSHSDHIGGVEPILNRFPLIQKIDISNCPSQDCLFSWNDRKFKVFKTPGHLPDHICFFEMTTKILFCGDILFRFGCGRIFKGTFDELFSSLQILKSLPIDTQIFCAHEYTSQNLDFCIRNGLIDSRSFSEEEKSDLNRIPTLPVALSTELKYNPFLRATSIDEFKKWRLLRNEFKSEQALY